MRRRQISHRLTFTILAVAVLVSASLAIAQVETVLHNFNNNGIDGTSPVTNLILDASGNLYGMTPTGGAYGSGVAFELLPKTGGGYTEKILHSFNNVLTDGAQPYGPLVLDALGNLYGTTLGGGAYAFGTIFELAPRAGGAWGFRILHSFNGSNGDANGSFGGLVADAAGNFYGTGSAGGAHNQGAVFELALTAGNGWAERVLYSFNSNGSDGFHPYAGLTIDAAGNLYGVTTYGGAFGNGAAFELSHSPAGWTETILHSFSGSSADGGNPFATLVIDDAGNLFGSTLVGGAYSNGTVFELTPQGGGTWNESIVHNFDNIGGDGYYSQATLLSNSGNLYGTTYAGGTRSVGTVFELSPVSGGGWTENILFNFNNRGVNPDKPLAGVVADGSGNLYGVTEFGGAYGFGAVFEITP